MKMILCLFKQNGAKELQMPQSEVQFECVRPIESHARLIMEWRNDPATLRMSFHTAPKEWKSFYQEFLQEYFVLPELPPLFILLKGERVAFLRFRPDRNLQYPHRKRCEISINVNPAKRGKGIASLVLQEVKSWIANQGFDEIYAEIKAENHISRKLFVAAGFKEIGQMHKKLEAGESVPIHAYVYDLTPRLERPPVFVVAEAGSNWRMGTRSRDLEMAKALINAAVDAGADAVKFQTFRPETVYVLNAGKSQYLAEAGIEEDIQAIFTDLAMTYEMIPELAAYCQKQQIQFMSTPFSIADFEAVNPYVSIHKIASYEISHLRLIELAARSQKPLILSTGASTETDIAWAVETFRQNGGGPLTLLQCTACYPAPLNEMNLTVLPWLKRRFKTDVGLSDHSRHPLYAPMAAVLLGATVIEKHFTLHNRLPGPDHAFALTPSELKEMVEAIRQVPQVLGTGYKEVLESEQELRKFAHRGIQAIKDINIGEPLKEGSNIAILRPGNQTSGVHPKHLSEITGRSAKRAISLGEGIQMGDW
jgi:sialic acid synthase SpsE/RimJ/RimL family protein N-acetyltransferase